MGRKKIVVHQYSPLGEFIAEWESFKSIQYALGFSESAIRRCCSQRTLLAYNYIWIKASDTDILNLKRTICSDLALELEDIEGEVWKDINGYEGLYQISNRGRIKGLEKEITLLTAHKRKLIPMRKSYIKKARMNRYGYYQVSLWKNGTSHVFTIHRLVATMFIPNPQKLPCVNHKDERKTNNNVENLEWCTFEYNSNYGTARKRGAEKCFKKVYQYSLEGEVVGVFKSLREASEKTCIGMSRLSLLCNNNGSKNGFRWSYKSDMK